MKTLPIALGFATAVAAAGAAVAAAGAAVAAAGAPAAANDPVADPKAVVTVGRARFTVLTPELIRLEWAADGRFEDHASFVFLNRRLPVPAFTERVSGSQRRLTVRTSALTLTYSPGAEAANSAAAGPRAGAVVPDSGFTAANLEIRLTVAGKTVIWHPGDVDAENLLGTTRTLDGAIGDKTREPIEPGLVSRRGWTLVDDSARPLFDESPWPWVTLRPAGERQDWYFFGYGHAYRRALGDYVRVAGRIPLPPRFAFGAWWSRYWAYSDQEIEEIVRGFRENDVPLDVFVIDMDWHETFPNEPWQLDASHHTKGWTGYSWNRLLFPDPEPFLGKLHADGLKVSLNLHPASGVQPWEDRYPEMARAMGVDPATRQFIPFDITDQRFARNYLDILHHPLEREGVDFWWLDWQQEPVTRLAGVNPTWWLNYVHFSDQQREGKRPLLFHRWGGLGNHRYQIGFSGDTFSVWDSLAFQPWFTATAANVGYAYWSHDIGGHAPGVVDPELFTRWVQFGAVSPILRTHTTKNPDAERRIWAYPEPYGSIMRATFQRRYALLPYLYTEARRTYDTGVAFVHPLYYDWPEAEAAYSMKGEYVFGAEMLAAPVTRPVDAASGLASMSVWIPDGDWIEWPTAKHLKGPATLTRLFSIDQTPLYVRAGAILPMQPPMRHSDERPVDPLIVNVWPLSPGQESSYEIYEDSGAAVAYQDGVFAVTAVHARQAGDTLRVEISPGADTDSDRPQSRAYELRLPADWPPAAVAVDGVGIPEAARIGGSGWRFEGNTLCTVIPVARRSSDARVVIEVRRSPGSLARRTALDGFAGAMTRLRSAYDALRGISPFGDAPDVLIDAMQAGDRLGYDPTHADAEIAHFHEALARVPAAVAAQRAELLARAKAASASPPIASTAGAPEAASPTAAALAGAERAVRLVADAGR
jgi:alpha-glucosidase